VEDADARDQAGASVDGKPDAFDRAVEALGHRERTTAELATWLADRGFDRAEIEAALGRLIELGELDDERFARRYAEDKRELAGWGGDRIREALLKRGLDRELIDASVAEEPYDVQLERAVELLATRGDSLADEQSRARALGFLARRGYESDLAYEAIRRRERALAD
jgi:regulatory protein